MLVELALILAGISSPACPDLSGLYVIPGEDGHVEVIISQTGCQRASIVWQVRAYDRSDRTEYSISLDNVFRPDTLRGKASAHATAGRFRGDTLEILVRPLVGPAQPQVLRTKWFYRRSDGDICVGSSDGGGWAAVAGLVDRRGIDAAATRAESANSGTQRRCS
jgi:hypothetical protein